MRFLGFALVGLVLGSVGCRDEVDQMDRAVWAADGQSYSYVMMHFTERPGSVGSGTTLKTGFEYSLFEVVGDGAPRAIFEGRAGQLGDQFFQYGGADGYWLLSELAGNRGRLYLQRRDGTRAPLAEFGTDGCGGPIHDFLPSPDGRTLGHLVVEPVCADGPPQPGEPAARARITASLMDAQTLLEGPGQVIENLEQANSTWTPAGDFVVFDAFDHGWRLRADEAPVAVGAPECTQRTSSSAVSADGTRLVWDADGVAPSGRGAPFSCR